MSGWPRSAPTATLRIGPYKTSPTTATSLANVTRVHDTADSCGTVFLRNQRVDPPADCTYDSLYRLIAATGREHLGQVPSGLEEVTEDESARVRLPHSGHGKAMTRYRETYNLDPVGTIVAVKHRTGGASWTRRPSRVRSDEHSNRLSATSLPGDSPEGRYRARYAYDDHGSMVQMPHLPKLVWDEQDRLASTFRQRVDREKPSTFFAYHATGNRVRKVTYKRTLDDTPGHRASGKHLPRRD